MNAAADMILHIVSHLQSDAGGNAPRRWALVPVSGRSDHSFADTAAQLAGMEKPLVVGALNHPGFVAVWPMSTLDENARRHVEHTVRNQRAALADYMHRQGIGDSAVVLFEGWAERHFIRVPDLQQLLSEYALTWGWRMATATDDSHGARLFVLEDGRRWSPGDTCDFGEST